MASPSKTGATRLAGIELGGTKCIGILASGPDAVHEKVEIATADASSTLQRLHTMLRQWRFDALGVASFGPLELDPRRPAYGSLVDTPKAGWSGVSLLALAEGSPAALAIDTDVNAAALAEGLWGAARGLRSWVYITVGTGVGVGSIVDGRPVRGLGHSEAGHIRVPRHGDRWPGNCAFHGDCVEGLASGPAIEARAGLACEQIPSDHIVWEFAADALAGLCHALVYTVVPERLIMGGGVMLGQPQLLPMIRARLIASLGKYSTGAQLQRRIDSFLVHPALGAMAGPLGAIALARQALTDT
ncbi:MAG TPA: ROK family protein [Steroidobacteraceae bacterium]